MDKKHPLFKHVCREIIEEAKKGKITDKHQLNTVKLSIVHKNNVTSIPTNIDLAEYATDAEREQFKDILSIKPIRVLSGVNVVALMTAPFGCPHGKCIYCPGGVNSVFGDTPQSYTGTEPSARRGKRNNYDPYLIVFNRLEQYLCMNRIPDKVEMIIMGGTFPSYPLKYRNEFIGYAFKAMNDFSDLFFAENQVDYDKFLAFFELPDDIGKPERTSRIMEKVLALKHNKPLDLTYELKRNETAKIRNVGLTIETKPDWARKDHGNDFLRLGCTRVELGVQTLYDDVLKFTHRGHTLQDTIDATRELKDLGFKINYHMMPGLPHVTKEMDLSSFKKLFADPDYRPDMLKIYPCMVFKGTKLYEMWQKGEYKPLTTQEAAEMIVEFKNIVPEYVRIMRVVRDIPTQMSEDGVRKTNLRQDILQLMHERGITCKCIRCREIGRTNKTVPDYSVRVMKYAASRGTEFFIEAQYEGILLGYCRLRFPSQCLREEITETSAIIRELHVYGKKEDIGQKGITGTSTQHVGIGKKLMQAAELICKDHGKNKILVISAIGTRKYYEKLGYVLEGPYMVKLFEQKAKIVI